MIQATSGIRVSWPFYGEGIKKRVWQLNEYTSGWAVDFRVPERFIVSYSKTRSRIGQSGEHCSVNKLGHKNNVFMADISSILSGVYEYNHPTQGQGYEA